MSRFHAPASASDASASGKAPDPLADVLGRVRLTGATMFMVDASSPWCLEIPHTDQYRAILSTPPAHIISFHVMLDGTAVASVSGAPSVAFDSGRIVVFPQGDGYRLGDGPDTPPELDTETVLGFFRGLVADQLPAVVPRGAGAPPRSQFLCGFLACDSKPFNPLLVNLPRLMTLQLPDAQDDSLRRLIEVAQAEFAVERPGAQSTRLHLCELIFIETLRRYILESTPGPGWLGALSDPVVGAAIAAIHSDPLADWTLDTLGKHVGASRSVLAERFAKAVGQSPIQYVTAWRIQLAAERLRTSGSTIAEIAWEVGYRSEAAFSRAFKKATGQSPGSWRRV